jgi:membrane fusion protein, multidrug efflux system
MTPRHLLSIVSLTLIGTGLVPSAARCGDQPSVLVQLTKLERGSLPEVVTVYGRVQASAPAQRAVTAPAAAVVDEIDVRLGEEVDKGAPLVRLQPTPLTASSYVQAETALRVASEMVGRTRNLASQHLATAQQLLDAQKAESDARSVLQALQAQGAGGANVLHAPFRAIVTGIATSPGGIVSAGATLLSLVNPDGLVLEVGALPGQADRVKAGDPVAITPIGRSESVSGAVSLRGSMIDPATGLVTIQITFPAGKLVFGDTATAAITTGQVAGYVVPHAAILSDGRGDPYVVQAVHLVAKQVPVHVLGAGGDRDVIAGPLDPGAPLVLSGNHQLQNGMKVRVADPPPNATP